MDENYFLKYFQFNKILLHCCGVLPIETWGSILNFLSITLPFCAAGFLVFPFFYTVIFRDLDFETAMDIFCLLLEGIAATFKGIINQIIVYEVLQNKCFKAISLLANNCFLKKIVFKRQLLV